MKDTGGEAANVFIVSQGDAGWDYYTLRYCLRPCTTSAGWHLTKDGDLAEGYMRMSQDEWHELLQNAYDYVVIYRLDDGFRKNFTDWFELDEGETLQERTVFKVDKEYGLLCKLE